ncbi:hypothetical protein PG987_006476 [Apiospora arundinis]
MHLEETQPPPTPRLRPKLDGLPSFPFVLRPLTQTFMIRHRRSHAGENSDDLPKIKTTRSGSVVVLPRIPELDMTLEQIEYNNRAREAARQLSQSAQVPINPGPGIAAGEVGGERPVEGSLAEQKRPTKDLPSDERLSDMALAFRQPSPDDRPARHSLPTLESRATSPRARPRPSASAGQADQAPVLTAPTLPAAESPPQTQSPSPTAAAAHPPPPPAAPAAAAPLPRAEEQNRKTQNAYRKAHSLDGPEGWRTPRARVQIASRVRARGTTAGHQETPRQARPMRAIIAQDRK